MLQTKIGMSIKELQFLIHRRGTFTFTDGNSMEGMIVSRYDIPMGRVEYYFIHADDILAYDKARAEHDREVQRKLGTRIEDSSISSAILAAA
ncbi:MAG: hypothetical protein ACKOA1_00190 [Bacteroidota bacterium]